MKSRATVLMLSLGLLSLGAPLGAQAADVKAAPGASAASACEAQATEKKLAGAAKTSFMKKCEADAAAGAQSAKAANPAEAACEKSAADKKLAGAAKSSHIKKCLADAQGGAVAAAASAPAKR